MKRFLIPAIIVLTLSACTSEPTPPNILFIMSDDHTSQAVSAYGGPLGEVCPTPHIDRLADEGMLFTNCFVTNSICTPSRAAIMTGKYAHKNGVYQFTAMDQAQPTLPKMIREAGYQTAMIGKYHLHSNPEGLDYFEVLPGQGDYFNPEMIVTGDEHPSGWLQQSRMTTYQGHSSDVIADRTLEYLRSGRDPDKPFLLFCHFKAPHDNWEYAERYADFLEDVDIPEPATLWDDYVGRSDALKNTLQYIGSDWGHHTDFLEETAHLEGREKKKEQYQLYMKKYLRCVKGVDDNVGRILEYLDESGLAENTIVVYTGDQGFYLGEHGLYDKRFMYEEGLRMPFLMRWPVRIEKGTMSEGMILNVDFAPTLLEAAGLEADPDMQGRSFLSMTRGEIPSDWRESMYYRYYYSHFETEPHYGVRTYTHKLIHFNRIDQWELYDLEKDPLEIHNLYGDPEQAELVASLKEELQRLQAELGDSPEDDGTNPDLGPLAPVPLHVARNLDLEEGTRTLLFRFKTEIGGTLFSTGELEEGFVEVWDEGVYYLSLYILDGRLFLFDAEEEALLAEDLNDGRWHTAALVLDRDRAEVYLDGSLQTKSPRELMKEGPYAPFNIGAGMDDNGHNGYNFMGNISHVRVYRGTLPEEDIGSFPEEDVPGTELLLDWSGS